MAIFICFLFKIKIRCTSFISFCRWSRNGDCGVDALPRFDVCYGDLALLELVRMWYQRLTPYYSFFYKICSIFLDNYVTFFLSQFCKSTRILCNSRHTICYKLLPVTSRSQSAIRTVLSLMHRSDKFWPFSINVRFKATIVRSWLNSLYATIQIWTWPRPKQLKGLLTGQVFIVKDCIF